MERLNCCKCNKLTSILDQKLIPYNVQGSLYCYTCIKVQKLENQAINVSNEYKQKYEFEMLTSTCDCYKGNPEARQYKLAGKFFDQSLLCVYCEYCPKNNQSIISLESNLPRANLVITVDYLLGIPDLSLEIKKQLLKNHTLSVDNILYQIRKYLCYQDQRAYCMKHLKASENYLVNKKDFNFMCWLCENENDLLNITDMDNFNFIIQEAKNYCKNAQTNAFNSIILKYLKNRDRDWKTVFNFLYEMKDLVDSINSKLSENSICLFCERPFNYLRLPYPVHESEKHEICSECLKQCNSSTCCPIDGAPIITTNSFIFPKFIYEPDLICQIHESNEWFSIHRNILPYKAKCCHNICSICYNSNKSDKCKNCSAIIQSNKCTENLELKSHLQFVEVICPIHNKPVFKWKIENNKIKIACRSCQGHMQFTSTVPDVLNKIKQLLTEKQENCQKLQRLLKNFDFLPLSYRYSLLDMNENSSKLYLLSNDIIPSNDTGLNFWYDKGATFRIMIEANVKFLICGIVLGKCVRGDATKILIESQENRLNFKIMVNENTLILVFENPIEYCMRHLFFNITLAPGKYYQRKRSREREEKVRFKFTHNEYFEVSFSENRSGDMTYGGPFIGLLGEDFYYLDSYMG